MITRGPVDVIVMAAGHPQFDGSLLAELEKLSAAGTIRVLDAMVLLKDENGNVLRLALKDLPPEQAATVGFIASDTQGLFGSDDADTFYEGMVPGSAIFALAVEHRWAVSFVSALANAGVETAAHFRVPASIVDEAFASRAEQT